MCSKSPFAHFLKMWEIWKRDRGHPEATYRLFSSVGYVRRSDILDEERKTLRKVEIEIRHHVRQALEALGKWMVNSDLLDQAHHLVESPETENLSSFLQQREEMELAFRLAREYSEEEEIEWKAGSHVQKYLEKVDDEILLHRDLVLALRRNNAVSPEEEFLWDPDFFWWRTETEEGCYLPLHFKSKYVANYVTNYMPTEQKPLFRRHILMCPECREGIASLEQDLLEDVREALQYRPKMAAAAATTLPSLAGYRWQDEDDLWAVELYLEQEQACSQEILVLHIRRLQKQEVAWDKMRLQLGEKTLEIQDGCAKIMRQDMDLALEKIAEGESSFCLFFLESQKKIPLLYRGETHA